MKFEDIRDQQVYGDGGVLRLYMTAPGRSAQTGPGGAPVPAEKPQQTASCGNTASLCAPFGILGDRSQRG